jgi:uncharacterized protein (DUF2141 family)
MTMTGSIRTVRLAAIALAVAATTTLGLQAQGGGRGGGQQDQPQRDTLNQRIGTASISGTVVTGGTGAPVRRARVTLTGAELRGGRSTVTDDEGRFGFVALPAGRFTLSASKAGYVSIAYGAKQAGRPGTPIQVAEGQKYERRDITMPRGSVVTGIVVDDHGEPAPGTQVRVMRFVMRTGERTLQQAGQDTTDDRGMYRIYGLQPGDYVVSAVPRNTGLGAVRETVLAEVEALLQQAQAVGAARVGGRGRVGAAIGGGRGQELIERAAQLQQMVSEEEAQTVAYAPVYYPGTTSAGSAMAVTLGVGEERAAIDFQLQLVQTATIDGSVMSLDGTVPQGVQVSLVPTDQGGMPRMPGIGTNTTRPGADGRFEFSNITPGEYRVMARANIRSLPAGQGDVEAQFAGGRGRGGRGGGPIAEVLWASVDLGVTGQDISGVVLALRPGMKVTGRIVFEGSATPPADLSNARVTLVSRGDQLQMGGGLPPAVVDASGQFTIPGVAPGLYTVSANVSAGGRGRRGGGAAGGAQTATATPAVQWWLKSAMINGRDALDFPLSVDPNQDVSGMLLRFTDQTQEISGSIQDASGRPTSDFTIVVYPADQEYWVPQSRRIAATRPDTEGRFTIRSLPAGNYRLTAVTDAEPGEWFNPDFLAQLVGGSIPITLAEGEKKTQDVRLAGG